MDIYLVVMTEVCHTRLDNPFIRFDSSPPIKVFYGPFQGGASFVDHFLFIFRVCHVFLSVHCSLVATCWERVDLLALLYLIFYCVLLLSHVVSWVMCDA